MCVEVLIEDDRWRRLELEELAERACRATLSKVGPPDDCEVAVLACNDERIEQLNANFRRKFKPTNVLSWPSGKLGARVDGGMPRPPAQSEIGDIAIAFDTCAAEAKATGKPMAEHVTHLIVHGTLHLLGFDHERDRDAELMERFERDILARLGISDPYAAREFLTER